MSIFTQVQNTKPKTSTFNLSHDRKQSLKMGYLIPMLVADTMPGDKWSIRTNQLIRFAPLVAPVMHQCSVYTHFFFVPNRLLWPNWEPFITGGDDGEDTSVHPYAELTGVANSTLADYMGLPPVQNESGAIRFNPMPFAAYQRIYNEYYQDQNLQAPLSTIKNATTLVDGDNTTIYSSTLGVLRQRSWQHDYYTSALPWTQKGPEATIPLGTDAPLTRYAPWASGHDFTVAGSDATTVRRTDGSNPGSVGLISGASGTTVRDVELAGQGAAQIMISPNTVIDEDRFYADLSSATAATINDLRQAFRLQEWLEKNARGGSRYIESILVHFNVKSSDGRLQRPEFLGGGANPIQFSEVLQTSGGVPSETTPQGNMAGHGISMGGNANINYRCEEHGYIIGIMSVMPRSSYYQGIPKHFLRSDKFDYPWPSFAQIGEQEILNKELYVDGTDGENDDVFGYTPRYAEMKFINSTVHGDFRDSLDVWTMVRKFATRPALNSAFIRMQYTEVDRIFAVQGEEDNLYAHIAHQIKVNRRLPYFGTPAGV